MEILKIKRSKQKGTGLKIYGEVLGDSGKTYKFAYIRRSTFRGWICACENFFLSKVAKNLNCKHLKLVRTTYGRYGQNVSKA